MASMFVECDLEMGLPHSFMDLKVTSDVCGTPYSQVSTAPGTPFHFSLPDPPMLPSKFQMGDAVSCTSSGDPSPRDAVQCFGMPALSSQLGRWAQKQVEAEYQLKKQKDMRERRGEETYLVDNSFLRAETSGLAFRFSKRVDDVDLETPAPTWGSEIDGVDCGDGWLKVGDMYLPMALHGMCVVAPQLLEVLVPSCESSECEALLDGPALTEDGRVLELEGGGSIFFSSDPKCSRSQSSKLVLIEMMKNHKRANLARAALDAEYDVITEAVCSIDPSGVVRGAGSLMQSATSSDTAERRKKFYWKKSHQKKMQMAPVLCMGADGKSSMYLYLTSPAERRRRRQEKLENAYGVGRPGVSSVCMIIDGRGIVRNFPVDDA